jgi:hypothetical protein
MKISKGWGLGLAVIAAALLTLLATSQASASNQNIVIERLTVQPGESGSVDLIAEDMDAPGLGAWEIGIIYNPAVAEATNCVPMNGSVCNPDFAPNQVRVTGASASGLENTNSLARITFACDDSVGTTSLTLSLDVIADATTGEPQPIDVKQINGSIDCRESPFSPPPEGPTPSHPTDEPGGGGATPTPGPGLPAAGTSGGSDMSGLSWLIAGSAAVALLGTAGLSLLAARRRTRN